MVSISEKFQKEKHLALRWKNKKAGVVFLSLTSPLTSTLFLGAILAVSILPLEKKALTQVKQPFLEQSRL